MVCLFGGAVSAIAFSSLSTSAAGVKKEEVVLGRKVMITIAYDSD